MLSASIWPSEFYTFHRVEQKHSSRIWFIFGGRILKIGRKVPSLPIRSSPSHPHRRRLAAPASGGSTAQLYSQKRIYLRTAIHHNMALWLQPAAFSTALHPNNASGIMPLPEVAPLGERPFFSSHRNHFWNDGSSCWHYESTRECINTHKREGL